MRHRRTDPACRKYRHPRPALGWWWFDRHRGLACPVCYGQHEHAWRTTDGLRRYLPTGLAVALVALAVGVMLAIGAALWTLGGVR